jgi:hypothetical protein
MNNYKIGSIVRFSNTNTVNLNWLNCIPESDAYKKEYEIFDICKDHIEILQDGVLRNYHYSRFTPTRLYKGGRR